jgi:mitochondrial FAD-linked sulfhydryl oxidase
MADAGHHNKKVAWYPDEPSTEDQQQMKGFFGALAKFYPCTWCAEDFQKEIKKTPPA